MYVNAAVRLFLVCLVDECLCTCEELIYGVCRYVDLDGFCTGR